MHVQLRGTVVLLCLLVHGHTQLLHVLDACVVPVQHHFIKHLVNANLIWVQRPSWALDLRSKTQIRT